jgi:predicted nucleotidyltransferase
VNPNPTVSGAHLYGFPSPDSDWDLRGVHVLPLSEIVGLKDGPDTLTIEQKRDGFELDLVTHDVKKFFGLLLRRNGYVLEQPGNRNSGHEYGTALGPRDKADLIAFLNSL